jgi:hypothetical protein
VIESYTFTLYKIITTFGERESIPLIHPTYMCEKKGLLGQNMPTILGSTINTIGGTYMTLNEDENLHFDNE